MLSTEEVHDSVIAPSRSAGERVSPRNGVLTGSGGDGIRLAKLLVADGGCEQVKRVKNSNADSSPQLEGDAEKILRFQSEVVTTGGTRLLTHRV